MQCLRPRQQPGQDESEWRVSGPTLAPPLPGSTLPISPAPQYSASGESCSRGGLRREHFRVPGRTLSFYHRKGTEDCRRRSNYLYPALPALPSCSRPTMGPILQALSLHPCTHPIQAVGQGAHGPRIPKRMLSGGPLGPVACAQHPRYLGPFPCCHLQLREKALASVGTMGDQFCFHSLSLFSSALKQTTCDTVCLLLRVPPSNSRSLWNHGLWTNSSIWHTR